ncbi:MAG: DNA repair protein RecN [Lachnospiraceae bacterium]
MLLNIHLKNLALIDEADISLEDGLNILSGETGAGKSVIIGSINMALGGKVSKDFIGNYGDYGLAELLFDANQPALLEKMQEMGIPAEDNQLILSRKLTSTRSICRANGVTVTTARLKDLAPYLLDVYGQNEHQSLSNPAKHLEILDEFSKEKLGKLKAEVGEKFRIYQKKQKELASFSMNEEERLRTLSFLEYEINEIDSARLVEGEEEELTVAYKKLVHMQQIMEGISEIQQLTSGDGGMSDAIGQALRVIGSLTSFDSKLEQLQSQMLDLESMISDMNYAIEDYVSDIELDESALQEIQERLDLIHSMKMKYGNSVSLILEYRANRHKEYQRLTQYEENRERCKNELEKLEKELRAVCKNLSKIRRQEGERLAKLLKDSLMELNFLDVQFEVRVTSIKSFTISGMDEVEFMISTNPGETLRPIREVASGGEMSRIMLAIKTVLADTDEIETLIFDEIDTGISGRTAQKVSEKLAVMGKNHQVICISHLPQIVSMADYHLLIEKGVKENHTLTSVFPLSKEESVRELARLLGGSEITENTLKNAEEMKRMAEQKKNVVRGK